MFRSTFCLFLLSCVLTVTATGQLPAHLSSGLELLNAQKFDEAAEAFDAITQAHPDDGQAWMLYGFALHAGGRLAEALAIHEKAASFPSVAASASYNGACAAARLGQLDDAFAWLDKACLNGFANYAQVQQDPDLQALRTDPRFARFGLPEGTAAAAVFVEPVLVHHAWYGSAPGDEFGWIARNVGDVDGDGVADAVISAPHHDSERGQVLVYSGRSGELLWERTGLPAENLGSGVEKAGDVNGDGVPDIAAGAPMVDGSAGKAYIFDGINGETVLALTADTAGDGFGNSVMGCGDVDGDGHSDVLVGAPKAGAGRATLHSGRTGAVLHEFVGERSGDRLGNCVAGGGPPGDILLVIGVPDAGENRGGQVQVYHHDGENVSPAFVLEAEATSKAFGEMFLSVVGDVNGDGVLDVYASDWRDGSLGPATGRIRVHSGQDGALLLALSGDNSGDGFGIGSAEAGDVDGDGHDDLIIGAYTHSAGAPRAGRTTLFSGKDGSVMSQFTATVRNETFGFDATNLGDVNGDDETDFLITSADSPVAGQRSGRVFVMSRVPEAGADDAGR